MANPEIDFLYASRQSTVGALLLACCLAFCCFVVWLCVSKENSTKKLKEVEVDLLQAQPSKDLAKELPRKIPPEHLKAVNAAVATLNVPWPQLFKTIERAKTKNVWLLGLEANSKNRILSLNIAANDIKEIFNFTDALLADPLIVGVLPVYQEKDPDADNAVTKIARIDVRWKE